MTTLEKFKDFSLNSLECRKIKGGDPVAYCTNGLNAMCYQYFDDAVNACFNDLGCDRVEVVQF
jgi:hypothetical protein